MAGLVSIVSVNPDQLQPAVLAITTSILENQTDNAGGNTTVSATCRMLQAVLQVSLREPDLQSARIKQLRKCTLDLKKCVREKIITSVSTDIRIKIMM